MATFYKRGKKWYALVRRKGMRTGARPFLTRKEAEVWARSVESKHDMGIYEDVGRACKVTMDELFERYRQATAETKRNAKHEKYALRLLSEEMGQLRLSQLTRSRIAEFRDKRLAAGLSASTVRNNLHLLSAVVRMAMNDWGYELPFNPVRRVSKPAVNNARNRRLEPDEEARLMAEAAKHSSPLMHPLIVVALETGMRLGELLSLQWQHVNLAGRSAHLPHTKNGDARDVPLSKAAIEALQSIVPAEDSSRVFYTWAGVTSFQHTWGRMLKRANITNLRFHDMRHEAASRFSEKGMDLFRIAAITGHHSLQMLKRYTHFRTSDLADELDRPAPRRNGQTGRADAGGAGS